MKDSRIKNNDSLEKKHKRGEGKTEMTREKKTNNPKISKKQKSFTRIKKSKNNQKKI